MKIGDLVRLGPEICIVIGRSKHKKKWHRYFEFYNSSLGYFKIPVIDLKYEIISDSGV